MTAYPIPAEALGDRLGIVGTSGAGSHSPLSQEKDR